MSKKIDLNVYQIKVGGVVIDPYRIAIEYKLGPLEAQALKKLLRCGRKHKTWREDIYEVMSTCQRALDIDEEGDPAPTPVIDASATGDLEEPFLTMDGYQDCVVGIVSRMGLDTVCYSYAKVIQKLVEFGDMSYDEAVEFHEFNQAGAWVGSKTPCFLRDVEEEDQL